MENDYERYRLIVELGTLYFLKSKDSDEGKARI